jgi:hypothetical protein
MPTIKANLGCVIDVTATAYTKVILAQRDTPVSGNTGRRGTLVNLGTKEVFVGWNKNALAGVDESAEADKAFLTPVGSALGISAIRVPLFCKFFVCRTASSTAKLIYVED